MSRHKLAHFVNYLFDFVRLSNERYFLAGDREALYLLNRNTNPLTGDPPLSLTRLNEHPFTGNDHDRWQSAAINNRLVLVNIATPPQVFVDNATPLAPLGAPTPDVAQPIGARFIINSVNHLVMANTIESDGAHPQRVRWSDINNPTVWTPALGTNEAGYIDLAGDSGEIRGLASIGPNQFVVYTTNDAYLFTYFGLPVIWGVQNKFLADIGIFAPYSLVTKENNHYFLGQEGFYRITSGLTPQRIGLDGGNTSRVDIFAINQLQINQPWLLFGFAHPIYPEIWFVYQAKGESSFRHALTYNWENNVWASRLALSPNDIGFPFTAASEFLLSKSRTMAEINTPASQTLTWQQKAGEGSFILITGDKDGFLYIHDGSEVDADGEPILRSLRTPDLFLGSRAKFSRLSRVFWDLQDVDFSFRPVRSLVLSKTNANDSFVPVNEFVLDKDSRHDVRAVDKIFQLGIDTTAAPSLSHITIQAQPAGGRA